jgi:hypothetical protein
MSEQSLSVSLPQSEPTDSAHPARTVSLGLRGQLSSQDRSQQHFQVAIHETVGALQESLWEFMPDCAYRDFYAWALSDGNTQRSNWLQVIGASQIVQLTVKLMSEFVNDEQWALMAHHSAPFNAYLVYEVVSDNLAIGLAHSNLKSDAVFERQAILHEFNRVVCQHLSGNGHDGEQQLRAVKASAQTISSFTQSLSPGKQASVVRAYLQQHPQVSLPQIEHSIYPLLIANYRACITTAQHTEQFQTREIIQHGLLQRYATVDALLAGKRLSLEQLTTYSAYAILLVPTIAYYAEGLAAATQIQDRFQGVVDDGSLAEALYLTALLVRLLNDFGTQLLFQSVDERWELIDVLHEYVNARTSSPQTLNEVLLRAASEQGNLFTRLKKDIQHGEVNLGLWYLSNVTPIEDAIMLFAHRLEYFSQQYTYRFEQLKTLLESITDQLGDETLSNVIHRCVRFHEILYQNAYDAPDGEYAV